MSQDLSQGKIYKITNDFNNEVYVGSTCDTLIKRFSRHRNIKNGKICYNRPLYVLMREIGTDRFRIDLIEDYPCEDKYQLRQREGFFIREMGTLNMLVSGRTPQECSKIQEQKETQKETREKYRENVCKSLMICECGCEITRHSLSRHQKSKKHLKSMETKIVV